MAGALLTDLSKAFDYLSHDLLIAKFHAYGLDLSSLKMLQNYLTNRKQRTKVDSFYSCWEKIQSGVPQGSILGPILSNIFMRDMFFILKTTSFTSYADNNTLFVVRETSASVIKALEEIDRLHERSLRIVYNDKTSDFSELLEKDGSVSIYYQNIWQLPTEMLKLLKGLCPEIVKGLFQFRNNIPYNLRQRLQIHIPPVRTVFGGAESIKFLGPKIWELITDETKKLESLWEFKTAIADYANNTFIGLVFFSKVFCFINNIFLKY